MSLIISNAILHSVGGGPETRFSSAELDIDSETCTEFVSKHVRRLLNNPGTREATFQAESVVYALVKRYQKGELRFREMSRQVCERLAGIIGGIGDIPPADILMTAFGNKGKDYLAILKLNYGECFTHRLVETEDGLNNQIVKNTAVLPVSAGKIEEACLIPFDPMVLRVMEKPHTVNGQETYYFSELFLECETELSKKEIADTISTIVDGISGQYFGGDPGVEARLKCALMEESEKTGDQEDGLSLEDVIERALPENEEVRAAFVGQARQQGLPPRIRLDKPFAKRRFQTQTFKADNGVEIKCPAELFQDPSAVQLAPGPDGTVTITLKNLRRCESGQ